MSTLLYEDPSQEIGPQSIITLHEVSVTKCLGLFAYLGIGLLQQRSPGTKSAMLESKLVTIPALGH